MSEEPIVRRSSAGPRRDEPLTPIFPRDRAPQARPIAPPEPTTPGADDAAAMPDVPASTTESATFPVIPDPPKPKGGRNLPAAIATGVLLAAVMIFSIFIHPLAFTSLIAMFVVIAVIESGAVLREQGVPLAVPAVLVGGLVTIFGAYQSFHAGQVVGILVTFVGIVVWLLADPERDRVVQTITTSMFFGLWTAFLASFGVLLVTTQDIGPAAVLLVTGGAIFGDIGGFVFGSKFGRTRVAPSVSPNKTVEGLVGGIVTAAVVAGAAIPLINDEFTIAVAAAVGALCAFAGFIGDLTESMIKRDLGIKDLGALIPGHGGMLDRVDGLLFALPVGFYTVMLLR